MATPREVALCMFRRLAVERELYQETVVVEILCEFGQEFVYTNPNGNLAIDRRALRAFRELTEKRVVWDRNERLWRWRDPTDPAGSRQVDY